MSTDIVCGKCHGEAFYVEFHRVSGEEFYSVKCAKMDGWYINLYPTRVV